MYVILKGIMIKRILLTTFVFGINYISGDINNIQDKITDTSTLTENSEDSNAPNLSNQESSDDTLPDQEENPYINNENVYGFSNEYSNTDNYIKLYNWLVLHEQVVDLCKNGNWRKIHELVNEVVNTSSKFGLFEDAALTAIFSACGDAGVLFDYSKYSKVK